MAYITKVCPICGQINPQETCQNCGTSQKETKKKEVIL
jgi:RNA polymerase subunit RPABC4/transcription elongation factor Spt4